MRRLLTGSLLVLVVLLVAAGALGWLVYGDRRLPAAPTVIDVAPGTSISAIADQLQDADVVSSARLLSLWVRARHLAGKIQAAEYDFPAHQSISDAATLLAGGGHAANVWVTIPEGYTVRQIARSLGAAGLPVGQSFLEIAQRTNVRFAGGTSKGLEGYLFPDTYLIPRHADASTIATLMTRNFMHELPPHYLQTARRLGYSLPQIVTIASMVEREAKVDDERRIMAGVYYNRLRLRMPLEVDATIEYALPQYKKALSLGDLKLDSPYNTYRHSGLPPTPIANPGRKSLLAAFNPVKTDYLYYVYRGGGRHQFSRTLDEQQAAERKYLR